MTLKEFKLRHFGTKKFYLHLAGILALCAGCADSQDPVRFTPKQQFEKSLRGNWSYSCKSKFRDVDVDVDRTFNIHAVEFSSQRVLIFTNSDKLVIRDRFFKDPSCEPESLACSYTIIYSYKVGDATTPPSKITKDEKAPQPAYELDLKALEGGDFDSQIDPDFCKQIEATLLRDDEIYTVVKIKDQNISLGVENPERSGRTSDARHTDFDPDQTATRF